MNASSQKIHVFDHEKQHVPAVLEGFPSSLEGGHMMADQSVLIDISIGWGRGKKSGGVLVIHLAAQEKHTSPHPVHSCNLIKWKDLSREYRLIYWDLLILVLRTQSDREGSSVMYMYKKRLMSNAHCTM